MLSERISDFGVHVQEGLVELCTIYCSVYFLECFQWYEWNVELLYFLECFICIRSEVERNAESDFVHSKKYSLITFRTTLQSDNA